MRRRRSSTCSSGTSTTNGLISVAVSIAATTIPSAKRPERGSHLAREELGLLPGGEVTALVDLVEVGDVRVRALDPAARRLPELARERREADGKRHRRRRLAGRHQLCAG